MEDSWQQLPWTRPPVFSAESNRCFTCFTSFVWRAIIQQYLARNFEGRASLCSDLWSNWHSPCFRCINRQNFFNFSEILQKGAKFPLSPWSFLILCSHPLQSWSQYGNLLLDFFNVPTIRIVLFQQQECIGFLQTTFVTDSRIYLVMALSQRACWMKTSLVLTAVVVKYRNTFLGSDTLLLGESFKSATLWTCSRSVRLG